MNHTGSIGFAATRFATVVVLVVAALAGVSFSLGAENRPLTFFGDFRARVEADFDSQTAAGVDRDDRTRVRIRARIGMEFAPDDTWSFVVRARTGSDDSHQSANLTILDLDDNDTGDADVNLDKWYVAGRGRGFRGWIGRNGFPFWKQNELFLDDDATPAGIAVGWDREIGSGKLTVNAAYLSLPVGMQEFSGNLGGGQLVYETSADRVGVTVAAGLFNFDATDSDPDAEILLNGNGRRSYSIVSAGVQMRLPAGARPLVLGADVLHNAKEYAASGLDPFSAANRDETDGYAVSARLGSTGQKGGWLVGYTYARIEALAVNSSYAQDDWVRWGTAAEARGSNMRGHELRFGYALSKSIGMLARLYLVDAITTDEDGNRYRVDFNYRFRNGRLGP